MSVRDILTVGHPLLRESAREIDPTEIGSGTVQSLIVDLIDTMRHALSLIHISEPTRPY